jgi:hypothetical protein
MKEALMKMNLIRTSACVVVASLALASMSCMTTYDSYGRPMQTVDPAVAIAGAAAAGVIGYAIAKDNRNDRHHYYHHNHHPRRGYYHY